MSYQSTLATGSEQPTSSSVRTKVLDSLHSSVEAYSSAYSPVIEGTGFQSNLGGAPSRKPRTNKTEASRIDRRAIVARREQSGRFLRECKELIGETLETSDPIEISNLAHRVIDNLNQLWEQRSFRENEWGDLINILQICLSKEILETFPREKWEAISRVFDECMGARTVTRTDVERGIRILKQGGFDPWGAMSGSAV